jgi:hypothetical protein
LIFCQTAKVSLKTCSERPSEEKVLGKRASYHCTKTPARERYLLRRHHSDECSLPVRFNFALF